MDTAVCAPADPDAPRWGDWLLGDQPEQRLWLARLLRVGALFLAFDLARALGVGLGHVPLEDMAALLAYDLGVLGVGYGLIRSGWSARLDDPAMTMPLVALALVSIVLAYVWMDFGRGALLPLAAVVLVHGMHRLTPRQTVLCAGALLVVLAGAAAVMALLSLQGLNLAQEAVDLGVAALGLPVLAAVAGRAHTVLQTHARQRAELAQTLARLEALTTKDTLTGTCCTCWTSRSCAMRARAASSASRCWTWTISSRSTRRWAACVPTRCSASWPTSPPPISAPPT